MNGVLFFNSFMSYLVLMLVIIAVAACGFLLGRVLRKRKDAKTPAAVETSSADAGKSK